MDSLTLGPVPYGESCVPVSEETYLPAMRAECRRFLQLLEQAFPPPAGAGYKIQTNHHDFGEYLEVEAVFDENNQEAEEWAFHVESSIPETWKELEALASAVRV